jgi:hypothetical protein
MFGMQGSISSSAQRNAGTAGDVGAGYGSGASNINAQLMPFLTRELNAPQGYTQQQTGSMLNQAEAGAGGATAGLTTEANLASARNRNSGGFSGALDEAARDKGKTLSGISSGIAAQDANLQQQHQQSAATGLSNMYGQDTSAQLKAMGLQNEDLNTAASTYGKGSWMNDLSSLASGVGGIAKVGAGFGIPGLQGFK